MEMTMKKKIHMVDTGGQYQKIKKEVDAAVLQVIESSWFIGGEAVKSFQASLESYLDVQYVIPCGNGTDALQIALMALDLQPGDEVIVPAFTYVATAEVIALLGLIPIMVDVELDTFNISIESLEEVMTPKTKAIVPVHLYGQSCEMEQLMKFAEANKLWVVEDNAQAIGAEYIYSDGTRKKTGTIGHIGCTSFYPSKNLGAFGDGGAIMSNDKALAERIKKIANHGQSTRYYHDLVGVNSRLDAIQAAILNIKLKHLDEYCDSRRWAAEQYTKRLEKIKELQLPTIAKYSTHVFHQYTLRIKNNSRNQLKEHLEQHGIPSMIYYPVALYDQKAYSKYWQSGKKLKVTEQLSNEVLSLPMHTELDVEQIDFIANTIDSFFNK